jgi:hypothetical protein
MVHCIANFMDACYIARRNAITSPSLEHFRHCVDTFQELRNIFIATDVRTTISLPRQHALDHFYYAMQFFGSPNGLCSSITESKHIKAVKEPWRRSSRFKALIQMLRIIVRMDKMAALYQLFSKQGMMRGTTSSYMAGIIRAESNGAETGGENTKEEEDEDGGPEAGNPTRGALSDVKLATLVRMCDLISSGYRFMLMFTL